MVPFHVVTYKINPDAEERKDHDRVKETITFAGFVSDHDPSLLFVMTYTEARNITYLKVLKIEKKDKGRNYSFYEDEEKKVFIESLKSTLHSQGIQNSIPKFDSVKVTLEPEQRRLHVTKRGFKDTNIPVNPGDLVADAALSVKL